MRLGPIRYFAAIFCLLKYIKSKNKSPTVRTGLIFCVGLAFINKILNQYLNIEPKYAITQVESNLSNAMVSLSRQ